MAIGEVQRLGESHSTTKTSPVSLERESVRPGVKVVVEEGHGDAAQQHGPRHALHLQAVGGVWQADAHDGAAHLSLRRLQVRLRGGGSDERRGGRTDAQW